MDPRTAQLAVLAHPLRSRLLRELRLTGPATATGLARTLSTNTGATSYHLRRLAAAGLVHDSGSGKGRQRVWQAASPESPWAPGQGTVSDYLTSDNQSSDDVGSDTDTAALTWLEHDYLQHAAGQYEAWLSTAPTWPKRWRDAAGPVDGSVLVTAEQLMALRAELAAVLGRYRRVGQGNPRARRVAVYAFALPLDLDRPPLRS